jgi:2-succinyl-5-enolpyruvyl-6-hydroxy-3-cyclohexene-1-carboxylate synthase
VLRDECGARGANADWLADWRHIDEVAGAALERYSCALGEPFEGRALADVVATLPAGATLFVSSSMPERDLDTFGRGDARAIRVLANRGANGIDGVVSSALGAAAAARATGAGPLVLVIGDLALYHDMNGLLAARLHAIDATVVVLDNNGGGIFSFLPQAAHEAHFEQLFGTPHGLEFASVAALYGARHHRVHDGATLRHAVSAGVAAGGLHLVEMRTDRARNVVLHREAWAAVADALDGR